MLHHWLIGLSLLSLPFWWGEPDGWLFEDAVPLETLTGYDETHVNAMISQDGSVIAWQSADSTCVFHVEAAQTMCYPWPEIARLRAMSSNLPSVSPDGRYVAQTENLTHLFYESDIWLVNTETGDVVNRTDDGIYGSPLVGEGEVPPPLDMLPIWNPVTGELYFFRSRRFVSSGDVGYTLVLYKMVADAGEPESVYDFSADLRSSFPLYRPVAFSADGTKLAMLMVPPNPETGVWVLDIDAQRFEQIASLAQLFAALPEWAREGTQLHLVQWIGDDLIVWTENYLGMGGISRAPLYVDTEQRSVVSLIDYSPFESAREYREAAGAGLMVYDIAIAGFVPPDGAGYWVLVRDSGPGGEGSGLFRLPLPGEEGEPTLVTTIDLQASILTYDMPPSVSADGKAILLDMLLTFVPTDGE